jgi:hypothetical protein
VLRICSLRHFGRFVAGMKAVQFQYDAEKGLFCGPVHSQEADQAAAQKNMVRQCNTHAHSFKLPAIHMLIPFQMKSIIISCLSGVSVNGICVKFVLYLSCGLWSFKTLSYSHIYQTRFSSRRSITVGQYFLWRGVFVLSICLPLCLGLAKLLTVFAE